MPQTPSRVLAFALICVRASLSAQRTWIVDAASGPGHDFTDLPPALAAATHGDRIVLRAGSYNGATTDRGVTILGRSAELRSPMRVVGLALGRTFVLTGVRSSPAPSASGLLECSDNAGNMHLDRVTFFYPQPLFGNGAVACRIERCRAVTAANSTFLGSPGVAVRSARVALMGCTLRGHDATVFSLWIVPGQPRAALDFAAVEMAHCNVTGGAGAQTLSNASLPAAAVTANESDLVLTGQAPDGLQAGTAVPGTSAPALAVRGGTLTLDPTLALSPTGTAPAIAGSLRMRRDARALRGCQSAGRQPSTRVALVCA
jgi:hypothetical protein